MKKIVKTISLILVLAVFAILAWGSGSESTEVQAPASVTTGKTESGSTPAPSTDKPKSPATAAPASTPKPSPSKSPTPAPVTIEEAVIFEQGGIKITAKSLSMNSWLGPEIKLLIENDSSQSITVQTRNAAINGYMIDTMMSVDVAEGKKVNDSLTFMQADLDLAGIKTIADIEFSFHIFDASSWNTVFDSDIIRMETSAADGFVYTYDDSGDLAYSGNGIEIIVKGLVTNNSLFGPEIMVYVSNTSNQDITVQVRDVSVNGFMIDTLFSCDVTAGKHAVDTITFLSSDLEENEIEAIENVELSFHIFNMDSWSTIVDTPYVTISFD